jgi:hypothetical protein
MAPEVVGSDLEAVIGDLNRQFGWDEPDARFSVASATVLRSSTITVVASDRGDDVVVKSDPTKWASITAGDVAEAMAGAAAALDQDQMSAIAAPPALAWSESPQLVVSPYIEGLDLDKVLSDDDHPLWGDPSGLEDWLHAVGRALAVFHRHAAIDETAYPRAVRGLSSAARQVLISPRTTRRLRPDEDEHLHARSYLDPSPGNWRREDDGTVWLLDPPVETQYEFVHHDIAKFLTRSQRTVRNSRHLGRFPKLREAFLSGYRSFGAALEGPRDRALLTLFQARFYLGAAKRSSRSRWQPTRSALQMTWQMRRQVSRPA